VSRKNDLKNHTFLPQIGFPTGSFPITARPEFTHFSDSGPDIILLQRLWGYARKASARFRFESARWRPKYLLSVAERFWILDKARKSCFCVQYRVTSIQYLFEFGTSKRLTSRPGF
jgi:hypothetical protein